MKIRIQKIKKTAVKTMAAILAASLLWCPDLELSQMEVQAAGSDSYMNLGIDSVSAPAKATSTSSTWSGDYIYFGRYYQDQEEASNKQPVKWKVLDTTGQAGLSSETGAVLLFSDKILDRVRFNEDDEAEDAYIWADSNLAKWLNSASNTTYESKKINYTAGGFLNTAFNSLEKAAIVSSDGTASSTINLGYLTNPAISGKKVFCLTAGDVIDVDYGFWNNNSSVTDTILARKLSPTTYAKGKGLTGKTAAWWLRSIHTYGNKGASSISSESYPGQTSATSDTVGIAPAINVRTSSILFTSPAAEQGSDTGKNTSFSTVKTGDVSEWKVTLKDGNSFQTGAGAKNGNTVISNSFLSLSSGYSATQLTITHKGLGAISSDYSNVTAALYSTDDSGAKESVLYYGSINTSTAATTSYVTIPAGLSQGIYKLCIYGEDRNSAYEVDYATGTPYELTVEIASGSGHTHEFGAWQNTADCTTGGVEKRVCKWCGYVETQTALAKDHVWDSSYTIDKEATCVSDGSKSIHCQNCSVTKEQVTIKATGHQGGTVTCIDYAVCKICDEPYGDLLPHVYNETSWEADAGAHWHGCINCGSKKDVEEHKWDEGTESSYTVSGVVKGLKIFKCTLCDMKKTEILKEDQTSSEGGTTGGSTTEGTTSGENTAESTAKKGTTFTFKKNTYQITKEATEKSGTAAFVKPDNQKLTSITIPKTVTYAGKTYLVTEVKKNAFKNCKKLKTAKIEGNVQTIGVQAFQGCILLKKVVIGSKVKKIGSKAFYGCSKLTSITVKTTKLTSKTIGSKAFTKAGSSNYKKLTVKVPKSKLKTYKSILKKKGVSSKAKIK